MQAPRNLPSGKGMYQPWNRAQAISAEATRVANKSGDLSKITQGVNRRTAKAKKA